MILTDRIARARMSLLIHQPFFGTLMMRLPMVPDNARTQTMSVDGRRIYYNETWTANLTDLAIRGVIVHELAHVCLLHIFRRGRRQPRKFNVAADHAINIFLANYIEEMKKLPGGGARFELPEGGCCDHQYANMSAEEIYNLLPERPPGQGEYGASVGEFEDAATEDQEDKQAAAEALEQEIKIAVVQAASIAKMRGKYPGCLATLVNDLVQPKVPWRDVLRQFMRAPAREDYSWARPARRYLHTGFIFPGMYSEQMGRIVIAIDTSGSMSDEILAEVRAEAQAVLDECKPESIEVLDIDAAVHQARRYYPGDTIHMDLHGRGGTDFRPAFDHVAKSDDAPPVAMVYLTDMYGSFPEHPPEYPVLWAATGNYTGTPPFGQLVAVS